MDNSKLALLTLWYKNKNRVITKTISGELWIPENSPPQLEGEVAEILMDELDREGVQTVVQEIIDEFASTQGRLDYYLDEYGFELNRLSREDFWAAPVFRLGAMLAYLGYKLSDRVVPLEETLDLTIDLAAIQGLPDIYAISLYTDTKLQKLVDQAFTDFRMEQSEGDGYHQVAILGAGCMRFHMQEAILIRLA